MKTLEAGITLEYRQEKVCLQIVKSLTADNQGLPAVSHPSRIQQAFWYAATHEISCRTSIGCYLPDRTTKHSGCFAGVGRDIDKAVAWLVDEAVYVRYTS